MKNIQIYKINIDPMGAVRLNRGDILPWKLASGKSRPIVYKYIRYKDVLFHLLKGQGFKMPESDYWIKFYIKMPDSWSKKKKNLMKLQPHRSRPDKDNLEKAFLDAIFKESDDSVVWDGRVSKFWDVEGRIEIHLNI